MQTKAKEYVDGELVETTNDPTIKLGLHSTILVKEI